MSDNEDNQPREKKQKLNMTEIANWKNSHSESELLAKKYVLSKNFQVIDSCAPGEVILRVESAYDPVFAQTNNKQDNISRRWLKCNINEFVRSRKWPFHEVIKNTSEVKLCGDLDGFKGHRNANNVSIVIYKFHAPRV